MCGGQLIHVHGGDDFVLGVAGDNAQILPVCCGAADRLLVGFAQGQVVFLGEGAGIQNLQTECAGDHACVLGTCVHGVPLADDLGLSQFEGQPVAVLSAAPLAGAGAVEHAVAFFVGVFMAGVNGGGLNRQLFLCQVAQGILGMDIDIAVFVGDGDLYAGGHGGLLSQVSLIDPVGIGQGGSSGAGDGGFGGSIPVFQQLHQIVLGAVSGNFQGSDLVPDHFRLLGIIAEALGGNTVTSDGDLQVRIAAIIGVDQLDIAGGGADRDGDIEFCGFAVVEGSNAGEVYTVSRQVDCAGVHIAVVLGVPGKDLDAADDLFHTQIVGVIALHPALEIEFVSDDDFVAAGLVRQFGIFEVFLHAGHQVAFIGAFGQIQLGAGPVPEVSVGVGSGIGAGHGADLAVIDGEVMQLGQRGDVQFGYLGAGQVQVFQVGAAGQIQLEVAVTDSGQLLQGGQITQHQLQVAHAVNVDDFQNIVIFQSQLGQVGRQHIIADLHDVVAAEIQFGDTAHQGQAGQLGDAAVGQIQRTDKVSQILQSGADLLFQSCAERVVGELLGIDGCVHISGDAVEEQQVCGGGNISVDIGNHDADGNHTGGGNFDILQNVGVGAEAVVGLGPAVDGHIHADPVAGDRRVKVELTGGNHLCLSGIGFAEVIGQTAEVVDEAVVVGQSQDVLFTVFHINIEGDGAVAGLGSGSGLIGVEVLQLDFGLAAVPGNNQLVVGGSGLDIGDAVAVQGDLSACALRAVDTHSADFQSDHICAVFQSLDVVVFSVCAADETLGAVSVDSVDVIVVDGGVVSDVPGDLELVGGVEHLLQLHTGGSGGSVVVAVGNNQAAQVDLIVFNSLGCGQLNADGGDDLAGILAQIHGSGGPAGLLAGVSDGQDDGINCVAVLEGDSNADLRSVISGRLVVSQSQLGVGGHIQLGLVEVDHVGVSQIAVDNQGGTAVVGADLGVGECTLLTGILRTVVPVHIQSQGFALRLDPPLPGGQDILNVQVGPLHITGNFTVQEVLHAVTVVEVGGKDGAVDDGLLNDVLGEALEVDGAGADVVTGYGAGGVFAGDLGSGGEVHALTLFHTPLISGLVTVVVCGIIAVLVPVTAPDGEGGVGLAVFVNGIELCVDVLAELPLAAFNTHVDHIIGVQTQGLGMSLGVLQSGGGIPVVQEDGIGDTAVLFVPDPAVVVVIESILVGNVAVVANGIVPLDVGTPIAHPLQHIPEQGDIVVVDILFLVDEVAVEAIVVHDVDELLGIGVIAVLILVQPFDGVLGRSGNKVLSQGQNTVLMGGIGGGSLGNCDGAVLKGADECLGFGIDLLGGTAAGTDDVSVLPELEQVHAEIIVCHTCVPGAVAGIGVAVVGGTDGVQPGLIQQIGICLGGGESADAVLQGDFCHQFFGIVVSCGIPVQDVNEPVAVVPGFVGVAGLSGFLGLCPGCEIAGQQGQDHNQSQHECQCAFHGFHNSLRKK